MVKRGRISLDTCARAFGPIMDQNGQKTGKLSEMELAQGKRGSGTSKRLGPISQGCYVLRGVRFCTSLQYHPLRVLHQPITRGRLPGKTPVALFPRNIFTKMLGRGVEPSKHLLSIPVALCRYSLSLLLLSLLHPPNLEKPNASFAPRHSSRPL